MLAGAVMISFSGVYVKLAHVTPAAAGFYRMLFGGGALVLLILMRREKLWNGGKTFAMGILCAAFFALDLFFWHKCIHHVGPGLATILANFQVFFLAAFGAALMGERLNMRCLMSAPVAILGLFLIVGIDREQLDGEYKIGLVLGLLAAFCYAGYILSLRRMQGAECAMSPAANLAVVSLLTCFFLGLEVLRQNGTFAIPDVQSLLSLSGYGIFSQVFGWVLITTGLPLIRASLAGLLLLLQPTLAFVWDVLFFGRSAAMFTIIGVLLTLAAIYIGAARRSKK